MRNFTRITAILLALFLTVAAKAEIIENVVVGDFTYNFDDEKKTAEVIGTSIESGEIVIPYSVTYLDESYTVTEICSWKFYFRSITSIQIPSTVTLISTSVLDNAFNCRSLKEINVDSENSVYASIDGVLYSKDMTTLIAVPCAKEGVMKIPNTVKTIKAYAFTDCYKLTSVIVPKSVESIHDDAFWHCVLSNIYLLCKLSDYGINSGYDGRFYVWSSEIEAAKEATKWNGNEILPLESVVIKDKKELMSGTLSFRVEDPQFPDFPFVLKEVKYDNDGTVMTPDGNGCYTMNVELETLHSFTVHFTLGGEDCTYTFDMMAKSPSVSATVTSKGQTYLEFKVTPSSDETLQPDEYGIYYGAKYYPADEKGKVRISGLTPNTSYYFMEAYAKYGENVITKGIDIVKTNGLSPSINRYSYRTSPTTIQAEGSKKITDATLKEEYFQVNGVKYPGSNLKATGLHPNTKYTVRYYVTTEEGSTEFAEMEISTTRIEFTILNPQPVSSTCAIVAAETNISEDETNVGFQWRKYDAPETLPSSEGYAAIYDGRLEGYIKNLQATSYYNVRAFYKTATGSYYYSDWIAFDPSDFSYFEPTVHTYPVDEVTEGTAKVKGYVLAGTDEITAQGFEYWPLGEDVAKAKTVSTAQTRAGGDVSVVMATGQVMTAELSNLQPGTTYCCRAFVTTVAGTTYGEEQTFTTQGTLTGVNTVTTEKAEPVIVGYYDLGGRKLNKPQCGSVTIVKYSDGTAKKAIFK